MCVCVCVCEKDQTLNKLWGLLWQKKLTNQLTNQSIEFILI